MKDRYVIGIDSSTQSVKAIVWDQQGRPVSEGRAPLSLSAPQPGFAEQDPDEWWEANRAALKQALEPVEAARVDGIGISNQRETVAFLDEQGNSLRPAMLWLDERAIDEVEQLCQRVGGDTIHRLTGKPVDVTPVLYRLRWMANHQPELLKQTRYLLDVQSYLIYRLTGNFLTSWTSADPFAIFDIAEKQWSSTLLEAVEVDLQQLPQTVRPGTRLGEVRKPIAEELGLAPQTPLFAAGGDGQCAGLGVNAIAGGRSYLNLGTAIIAGASSSELRLSNYWRTMTSPTGEGYFLEAVQRAGAYFVNWFADNFSDEQRSAALLNRLEQEASGLAIGSEGVVACTYLAGCMDPYWNPQARGAFLGLGTHHTQAHLYRASLEALTLESARALKAMQEQGVTLQQINVIGGGAQSTLWMQMIADSTGLPAKRSLSNEASSLGAAISAAVGAGWYASFEEAANAMTNEAEVFEPNSAVAEQWEALSTRQGRVYQLTSQL